MQGLHPRICKSVCYKRSKSMNKCLGATYRRLASMNTCAGVSYKGLPLWMYYKLQEVCIHKSLYGSKLLRSHRWGVCSHVSWELSQKRLRKDTQVWGGQVLLDISWVFNEFTCWKLGSESNLISSSSLVFMIIIIIINILTQLSLYVFLNGWSTVYNEKSWITNINK